ncbi:hypothetical protein RY45_05975 [Aeromonas hydrophila]|nr:hypothetical protein RY45_05975 [Aeromonas hydrophila]
MSVPYIWDLQQQSRVFYQGHQYQLWLMWHISGMTLVSLAMKINLGIIWEVLIQQLQERWPLVEV